MPESNSPTSPRSTPPVYVNYFSRHYDELRFPLEHDGQPGLRRGQIGALHAIAAHFTFKTDPAVITMPTGSGKTVVLALSPYILRANRVLAITPSRLVRNQITDEFEKLDRVKSTGALNRSILPPRVIEIKNRISTEDEWNELASYDVVVGTPNCVSPAYADVAKPPEDFFDLILLDEAHHSPARSWNEILTAFPEAKKLLVTATPFRRDRKEIKGIFVFDYPVRQAYRDGVFGHIEFLPVEDHGSLLNDVNIAQAAERVLLEDRNDGLDHFLMVRTDLKTRAATLEKVYSENTTLKLKRIDSSKSLKHVRNTIDSLKNKKLDGLIAVDMLGEGFDFPNLKIAAVHSPHKSLAATLQFVGRFARTGSPTIGQAKFIAVTQEIKGELRELWTEGSEWHEIIPSLNDERIQNELDIRTTLSTFRADERIAVDEETEDLSLYSIRPYSHVKIYRVAQDLDITSEIDLVRGLELKHREVSNDENTVVLITKEETQPKWASPGRFRKVEYDLFIIHIERDFGLLFICTSRRRELVYRQLIAELTGEAHDILPVDVINRVLNDLDNAEAFSVGMRNRLQGATESYRIMAGPKADKAIKPNDRRIYHRGHAMFRGRRGGIDVTVGLSSSSKVWSNSYLQIPYLLQWCRMIAVKLSEEKIATTNTNWDGLPMPTRISSLPPKQAIGVDWDADVYLNTPLMLIEIGDSIEQVSLLDADIKVDREQEPDRILFRVIYGELEWPFKFTLAPAPTIDALSWSESDGPTVEWEEDQISLTDFLRLSLPTFYFADFSTLTGRNYLPEPSGTEFFDPNRIETIDWIALNVDIEAERYNPKAGKISVHTYLINKLSGEPHRVVVYDDGTGEVADFLSIDESDMEVRFTLYHAKGSHGAKPGERVADVYEVCGQAVKSIRWTLSTERLLRRLLDRSKDREIEWLITGTRADLSDLQESVAHKRVLFEIVIVQPGISRARLQPDNIALPLASADLFIREGGAFESLRVWGSA